MIHGKQFIWVFFFYFLKSNHLLEQTVQIHLTLMSERKVFYTSVWAQCISSLISRFGKHSAIRLKKLPKQKGKKSFTRLKAWG